MPRSSEPCGCKADERQWITLCPEHQAFADATKKASTLESFYRLCSYWEAHPTDDNLRCIVDRMRLQSQLLSDVRLSAWIVAHKVDILRVRS